MAKFPFKNFIFLMQKRLSASTSTNPVPVVAASSPLQSPSFTVEYLVNSCGLPFESAIAASRAINLNSEKLQRYNSVLNLFKSYGFEHTHIAAMIEKRPQLLIGHKVDGNLRPKLEYFTENGFSGPRLCELINSNPAMLSRSLSSHLKPSLEYLRSLLGTEERVWLAVKKHSWLLTNDLKATLQPNIDLLVKEGLVLDDITQFLVTHSSTLQSSADRLASALKTVKDRLGIHPSDSQFLIAVTRIASSGVQLWEKKMEVFKSCGFSEEESLSIFRRFPYCISRSEETLRMKLEFYLDTVKLNSGDVISYPSILSRSIDTTSRPRHNVLKVLLSKKLLKKDAKLARLFLLSEEEFLTKYVAKHLQQVPSLLEMYSNDKVKQKIGISALAST